eukprot:20134-Heterococcus_DN1.PRE.1
MAYVHTFGLNVRQDCSRDECATAVANAQLTWSRTAPVNHAEAAAAAKRTAALTHCASLCSLTCRHFAQWHPDEAAVLQNLRAYLKE